MFLISALIYAAVLFLYRTDIDAVLYAAMLCMFFGGIILAVRFIHFYRIHMSLKKTENNIAVSCSDLPETENIIYEDYNRIIREISEQKNSIINEFQGQRTESMDFYTSWVHQIKTPIAAMQMILQSDDTDEHRQLQAELFRIEQYTDMVLQYFRLDESGSDFVFRKYRIDDIIKKSVRKYAPVFIRKRIRLIYEPSDAEVLTDEKWLMMILEQLLSNAVKYTSSGSVIIDFSEDRVLSVKDTGIGIAAEDIPRIFEKGFTGYNGRSGSKSTGLGLYLCRKAADRIGCSISVSSEPGEGSTFSVEFGTEDKVHE